MRALWGKDMDCKNYILQNDLVQNKMQKCRDTDGDIFRGDNDKCEWLLVWLWAVFFYISHLNCNYEVQTWHCLSLLDMSDIMSPYKF